MGRRNSNQLILLAVVAALGLFIVVRRSGQAAEPAQPAAAAPGGGAVYEGGARGVRSDAEGTCVDLPLHEDRSTQTAMRTAPREVLHAGVAYTFLARSLFWYQNC